MSLPSFSVRRRVTTLMVFTAVAVLGLVAFTRLSIDMFPDVELPTVTVVTYYPGASASDVEEKVTDVLEDSLAVTTDLEEMSSISRESLSVVTLQFAWGSNLDEVMNDVRTRLDFVARDLPEDAERPLLLRVNIAMLPIMTVGVTAAGSDVQVRSDYVEEHVVAPIEQLDGVASVVALNQRRRQVLVEVDRQRLEDYGLSLEQIAGMVQMENLTLPAGTIDVGRTAYTLRVPGELETVDELREVIVSQTESGLVYLRDVASVREGLEDSSAMATVEGESAIILLVQRESGANTVEVAGRVGALVAELNRTLPEDLTVTVLADESSFVTLMMGHLSSVVYYGGLIVLVVSFLFLRRVRTTLIVVLTVPVCLIAVFAALFAAGHTLNMVSMASIALAIGIVVDSTIVVVENVVRRIEAGDGRREGAVRGAEEVGPAVMASSLTNVAVFAPVVFVGGILGVFFDLFAYVILVAVVMSLLVSLMLAPAVASRIIRERDLSRPGRLDRLLARPMTALERAYGRLIELVVSSSKARASVVVVAALALGASMTTAFALGQDFLPSGEGGNVSVEATMPTGTSAERTAEVARRMEAVVRREVPEAELTYVRVGRSRSGLDVGSGAADNVAMIGARLPPLGQRDRTNARIEAELRPALEAVPGPVSLEVGGGAMTGLSNGFGGRDIELEIYSAEPETSRRAAVTLRGIVERTRGTADVATDPLDQVPELRLEVDRARAARLGVPMAKVAAGVRLAMHGHAVTRFRGGGEDVEIYVQLRAEDRASIDALRRLTVPSLSGAQVRLDNIAEVVEAASPVEVRRLGGNRAIRVMANVEARPLNEVRDELDAEIRAARARGEIPADLSIRFGGEAEELRSTMRDMTIALLLAILLVYMVMAAQFESFLDPLVIMFSVPFGVTGSFVALLATGVTLQVTSFMGMVIIVGIVVNNAIVLVDYINEMRRQGLALHEAVVSGGARRLRPVLMTSLTTIGGMFPLAIATGEGANIWRPLGIAVVGGLLVSMLVTLVLVPAVYVFTERWRRPPESFVAARRGALGPT